MTLSPSLRRLAFGIVLGASSGLGLALLLTLVIMLPAARMGLAIASTEVYDALRLFIPPGVFGGTVVGAVAVHVERHRVSRLLATSFGVYPLAVVVGLACLGGGFWGWTWATLVVTGYMAFAYAPIVAPLAFCATLGIEWATRRRG